MRWMHGPFVYQLLSWSPDACWRKKEIQPNARATRMLKFERCHQRYDHFDWRGKYDSIHILKASLSLRKPWNRPTTNFHHLFGKLAEANQCCFLETEWLMLFGCSVGLLGLEQSLVVKLSVNYLLHTYHMTWLNHLVSKRIQKVTFIIRFSYSYNSKNQVCNTHSKDTSNQTNDCIFIKRSTFSAWF